MNPISYLEKLEHLLQDNDESSRKYAKHNLAIDKYRVRTGTFFVDHLCIDFRDTRGNSLLTRALLSRYFKAAALLLEVKPELLETPNANGETPLQIMVSRDCMEELNFLLPYHPNLAITDSIKRNLLHLAASAEMAEKLLALGVSPNALDARGSTPLEVTISSRRSYPAAQLLAKKAGISILSREHKKENKAKLVSLCASEPPTSASLLPTACKVINSITYPEDSSCDINFNINKVYPELLLKPIMDVMAIAGLGQHDAGIKSGGVKKFKIFMTSDLSKYVAVINPLVNMYGFYAQKNSVFITYHPMGTISNNRTCAFVIHESTHFVMNEVFRNHCNPFFENDHVAQQAMKNVIARVQRSLGNMKQEPHGFCDIIRIVFETPCYGELTHAAELIVRVPEIIALSDCGTGEGTEWLRTNVPDLLDFYINYVMPPIMEYLIEHRVTEHLAATLPYEELLKAQSLCRTGINRDKAFAMVGLDKSVLDNQSPTCKSPG